MDKKNQLDVTFVFFIYLYAVIIRGVTQICLTVSGLCVVMRIVVGGGFIVVCRCGSVCNQIKVHNRGCRKVVKSGWQASPSDL